MSTKSKESGVPDEDRLAVETLYRAFSEGNPDLLDQAVAADWQDVPLAPHQGPGREGIKPLIREFREAFPDLRVEIVDLVGGGGRVAVRGAISGTHRGAWFGVAATHQAFRIPIHEFHTVENGRITHTWHLEDWFGWLNQVGAWPARAEVRS